MFSVMSICNLDFSFHFIYNEIIMKSGGGFIMATEKRPTMLRLPEEIYEKVRYLAFVERRSVNMQIEHALSKYIEGYEKQHGTIHIPKSFEEK